MCYYIIVFCIRTVNDLVCTFSHEAKWKVHTRGRVYYLRIHGCNIWPQRIFMDEGCEKNNGPFRFPSTYTRTRRSQSFGPVHIDRVCSACQWPATVNFAVGWTNESCERVDEVSRSWGSTVRSSALAVGPMCNDVMWRKSNNENNVIVKWTRVRERENSLATNSFSIFTFYSSPPPPVSFWFRDPVTR